MAELDVQPKKTPIWLWLLLLLILLALIFLFSRGCNQQTSSAVNDKDSTAAAGTTAVATTEPDWESVDFNSPASVYDEITDTTITVGGNDRYTIYGLGENILFASGQSSLQGTATDRLRMISSSLKKRFEGAYIGVYGHADSKGDAVKNKQLAEDRAVAVRLWLIQNGNIPSERVSVHSRGESEPVATNATPEGRQQNRNVEIVAFANPQ